MYARVAKPKLSLKISSVATSNGPLPLKSPMMSIPRSPMSPAPLSPRTAKLVPPSFASRHQSTLVYTTSYTSTTKSILKKPSSAARAGKKIQFKGEPVVHPITPIENPEDYYGSYVKMSKDDRRWSRLSES